MTAQGQEVREVRRTAVREAAENNKNAEVTKTLIQAGANVNYTNSSGFTPLSVFRFDGNPNPQVGQAIIAAGGR